MEEILRKQREYFLSGATLPIDARRDALKKLYEAIEKNVEELQNALKEDLDKSATESYMCEIGLSLSDITYTLRHLKGWMRPERHHTSLHNFPARSRVLKEPYGVALIMSPWNYPFLLLVSPLIGALAAGNCCVLKPSELAPATAKAITRMIEDAFPPEFVTVVNGGVEESQALLALDFDYIFYTGSVGVGKIVMEKAAKHLTPVTLELGGKSPVIITRSADLRLSARRIVFGKYLNAGQTCIAPDYVLCEQAVHDDFVKMLMEELVKMFGAHALALYLFTKDKEVERQFMTGLQFGGGCVNDVISQITIHNMPFGGIGESGMGAYHGKDSFLTFTHRKTVVARATWLDPSLRYQPYKEWKDKFIRRYLK